MNNEQHSCIACGKKPLVKEEVAICKKLLGVNTKAFYCLSCFSDYLKTDEQDILDKIEEFKEEGCKLFS